MNGLRNTATMGTNTQWLLLFSVALRIFSVVSVVKV
jgi:hypothetical protein